MGHIQEEACWADEYLVTPQTGDIRRPPRWWLIVGAITLLLAAGSLLAAIAHQDRASQPIGEGEVFEADAAMATEVIMGSASTAEGVRHARNLLDIEAVSLVDKELVVVASTSETLTGKVVDNSLLAYGVATERFAALAVAVDHPLEIDGVVEWPSGSILYQVISPLSDGEDSVLLHYDLSELLARRAQPGEIHPLTLQLLALAGVFVLLGVAVFIGHGRATQKYRELAVESDLLRAHSDELKATNVKLAEARHAAERALALAEEKMRIRSDFVLMINHELRTPLTSVVTGAELVRRGELGDAERDELLDSMVSHGERLAEMIDQILAVAGIENRGLSSELSMVPVEEVCAATNASPPNERAHPDRQIWVRTDLQTLTLAVASLTDNARTHGASRVDITCSTENVIEGTIEVGARPETALYLTVTDDGPGIDAEFLPRVFEKFEKKSFHSGTGLGLYLVRLMVEALRGSISVHTSPEGTTFQIALPAVVKDRVMEAV
ncbi:MAG: sensor histidine kinase [Acidimicrobiia bacterium]